MGELEPLTSRGPLCLLRRWRKIPNLAIRSVKPLHPFRPCANTTRNAIAWGCCRLSLGRTALEPKAALGAKPEPMSAECVIEFLR